MNGQRGRGTTIRGVRIPDDRWAAAGERAEREGSNRSEVINRLLEEWLALAPVVHPDDDDDPPERPCTCGHPECGAC